MSLIGCKIYCASLPKIRVVAGLFMVMATGCTYQPQALLEEKSASSPTCDNIGAQDATAIDSSNGSPPISGPNRVESMWGANVGGFPQSIVTGDFNHDDIIDLATLRCSRDDVPWDNCSIAVLHGLGDGTFVEPMILPRECLRSYRDLRVGDFDGNGFLDLAALAGPNELAIAVWYGDNAGFTGPKEEVTGSALVSDANKNLFGWDWNGFVNHSELLVPGDFREDVSTEFYWGAGGTGAEMVLPFGRGFIIKGDFDEDGKDDMVREDGPYPGSYVWLASYRDGAYCDINEGCERLEHDSGYSTYQGVSTRLDGDSHIDLGMVVYNYDDGPCRFAIFLGNGDGTFKAPIYSNTTLSLNDRTNSNEGDFDGDGKADVLVSTRPNEYIFPLSSPAIRFLLGDGYGGLQERQPLVIESSTIATGDFNDDGATDVVFAYGWFLVVVSGPKLVQATK